MASVQQSLRGSLLTGASAFAFSVTGYSAQAQGVLTNPPSPWTVWVEGAFFQTGGGGMNVPSLPGLSGPFTSVGPKGGWEAAAGFDYNVQGPWHYVFDIRYGKSKTATAGSSSSSSSSFQLSTFKSFFSSHTSATNQQSEWERESHLVADFMVGRDFSLGLGNGLGQVQFGIRVADLSAHAFAQQNATTKMTTFFSTYIGGTGSSTATATESAVATLSSRFFGVGPRLAVTGNVPIWVAWSFDYEAGIAELIGNRSFNYAVTVTPGGSFSGSNNSLGVIFNIDGWAGLSYTFANQIKVTGGIRADNYVDALTTYNVAGGFTNVDRLYWGPFLRLTGKF